MYNGKRARVELSLGKCSEDDVTIKLDPGATSPRNNDKDRAALIYKFCIFEVKKGVSL